jgi:hypothetical protein
MLFTALKIFAVIMVVIAVVSFARIFVTSILPYLKDGAMQNEVQKSGVSVNATVIQATQTSAWGGNKPIYQLRFRFMTHDGHEVEASMNKALTFKEIERYFEGARVAIKYDLQDPKRIALDNALLVSEDR